MREVFREHRPTVVFHAAAYKHVGLMEENPVEAVRNNAIATRVMARVAGDTGTKIFVQVSTDKAVDPATVMGASKALAEWAAEAANARYPDTAYTSVRFGNVLNSSGSVVPIFRRQIEAGGPVTVTDPDMTRFFMTIPEAVQLVIRAGSLAQGGEVFVLEMGEPVRIMDLARGHDPLLRPRARARHRDRHRRPPPRREAPRGPVQRLRAPRADPGAEDPARAPAGGRSRVGGGDASTASGCWCSRATRRASPPRSPSWRRAAWRPSSPSRRPSRRPRWTRRRRRAARQPGGLLDSTRRPWSTSSRSRSRTRSRSTAPTSASRRSSAWPCSPSSTSPRRASCAACAIGPAARPSARRRSRRAPWRRPRPRAACRPSRSAPRARRPAAAGAATAAGAAATAQPRRAASRRPRSSSPARAAPQAGNGTAAAASEAGEGASRPAGGRAATARSPAAAARRPPARSRGGGCRRGREAGRPTAEAEPPSGRGEAEAEPRRRGAEAKPAPTAERRRSRQDAATRAADDAEQPADARREPGGDEAAEAASADAKPAATAPPDAAAPTAAGRRRGHRRRSPTPTDEDDEDRAGDPRRARPARHPAAPPRPRAAPRRCASPAAPPRSPPRRPAPAARAAHRQRARGGGGRARWLVPTLVGAGVLVLVGRRAVRDRRASAAATTPAPTPNTTSSATPERHLRAVGRRSRPPRRRSPCSTAPRSRASPRARRTRSPTRATTRSTTGNNTDQQRAESAVLYGTRSGARAAGPHRRPRGSNIANVRAARRRHPRPQRGRRRRRDPRPGQGPVGEWRRPPRPGRPARALVTTLARVVFLALVAATFGAFFVAQRLKGSPPVVQLQGPALALAQRRRAQGPRASFALRVRESDVLTADLDRRGRQPRPAARSPSGRSGPSQRRSACTWDGRTDDGTIAPDGVYRIAGSLLEQGRSVDQPAADHARHARRRARAWCASGPGQVVGPQAAARCAILVRGRLAAQPRRASASSAPTRRSRSSSPRAAARPACERWIWNGRSGGKPVPAGRLRRPGARSATAPGNVGSNPARVPFDAGRLARARPGSPCARSPRSRRCGRSPRARGRTSSSTRARARTAGRSAASGGKRPGAARQGRRRARRAR